MLVFDKMVAVGKGILRGMGLQKYSAWIFFFSYWIITLPSAAVLVLVFHYSVYMVWIMVAVGAACSFCLIYPIVVFTNWEKLLAKIQARLQANQESQEETHRK